MKTQKTEKNNQSYQEQSEELWDKHSEHVEDSSYGFDAVAGTSLISKAGFERAIKEFHDKNNLNVNDDFLKDGEICYFAEWLGNSGYQWNNELNMWVGQKKAGQTKCQNVATEELLYLFRKSGQ